MSSLSYSILITRPISLSIWTAILTTITVAICSLLYFVQYTQKHNAEGVLVPDKGLVNVITPSAGQIASMEVAHGQAVKSGQVLYKILTNRAISETDAIRSERRDRLASMEKSLRDDIDRQKNINQDTVRNKRQELRGLQSDLLVIEQKLSLLTEKAEIAKNNLTRYEKLADQNLFSRIQSKEKRIEYLDIQSQKIQLESDLNIAKRNIEIANEAILIGELNAQNQLADLTRKLDEAKNKLLEYDSAEYIYVIAPSDGTVANVHAKLGQHVDSASALLTIIPADSELYAELYVPGNAIGFVSSGDRVQLRYRAFPYQKFGYHKGVVKHVSRAPLYGASGTLSVNSIYKITVVLPEQYMVAYGQQQPLQTGMEIDAAILIDKRRLYEWLFEPLMSMTRK
jgi:membrane fusion protein